MNCILCGNSLNIETSKDSNDRIFYKCNECSLKFVDKNFLIPPDEEKQRYTVHENTIENKGYVKFLNKAITPALDYIDESMTGLDYGCGPGPTLSSILKQHSITCYNYDPFFFPELKTKIKYNFIFATECFEHFFNPIKEIEKIDSMLENNGFLIIMTKFLLDEIDFSTWYYAMDKTHVTFYNEKTFLYISNRFNYKIVFSDKDSVIILKKTAIK